MRASGELASTRARPEGDSARHTTSRHDDKYEQFGRCVE